MKGTDIFNGTNGTLWLSTDDMEIPVGSFQTFTLHQNNEFEDVNEAEFLGKKKRLLGYELTGTISKYKTDHAMADIMEKYKDGETPDINFVAKAYNPNTKSIINQGILFFADLNNPSSILSSSLIPANFA